MGNLYDIIRASYSTCTNIVKTVKDPRLPNKLSYLISPMEPVSLSSGGVLHKNS